MKTTVDYPEFSEFENRLVKRLATSLAARFHLVHQDREDLQQEYAAFLWQQKTNYDPEHVSGSGYETYITKCLERKSLEILRSVRPDISVNNDDLDTMSPSSIGSRRTGMATDLRALYRVTTSTALGKLTPQQKELFKQLGRGKSVAEIAAESGVKYATVHARVRRLRTTLKANGFDISMN